MRISSIKKEIMEGFRCRRFLMILATFLFIALMFPVLHKYIMPAVVSLAYPDFRAGELQSLLVAAQLDSIYRFIEGSIQIRMLIIIFLLSGLTAGELRDKTLILPITAGRRFGELIAAKIVVYGSALISCNLCSAAFNYLCTGLFYSFDLSLLIPALRAGALQGLYLTYVAGWIILIGTITKKSSGTGLVVLVLAYLTRSIGSLLKVNRFLPSGLLVDAEWPAVSPPGAWVLPAVVALGVLAVLCRLSVMRLNKLDMTCL